jgi:hypothetical protein
MKKPKKAKITYTPHIEYVSSYTCPHCNVTIIGASINKCITRFLCGTCNNEIIVDKKAVQGTSIITVCSECEGVGGFWIIHSSHDKEWINCSVCSPKKEGTK